jgi:hypothetical protein
VDATPEQVTLDARVVDPEVSQVECDQASPSAEPHRFGRLGLAGLPIPMPFLERSRQAEQLTPGHRGEAPADDEHSIVAPTRHPVADTPLDGALERRMPALGTAESEAPSRLAEVELESFGGFVEPIGETT